jgi:hypothetical protein
VPIITSRKAKTAAQIAFVRAVINYNKPKENVIPICPKLLKSLLENITPREEGKNVVDIVSYSISFNVEGAEDVFKILINRLSSTESGPLAKAFFQNLDQFLSDISPPASRLVQTSTARHCIFAVFRRHVLAELGPFPRQPTSWTRPAHSCTCRYCLPMSQFFQDPYKQAQDFRVYSTDRNRMAKYLDKTSLDQQIIEYSGSGPRTGLRITKTLGVFDGECRAWESRKDTLRRQIAGLNQTQPLEPILRDRCNDVVTVDAEALSASSTIASCADQGAAADSVTPTRLPLASTTANTGTHNPSTGSKRRTEEDQMAGRENLDGFGAFQEPAVQILDLT